MNILSINPGHNGSAALVVDGKLELYLEEERMSRVKRDGNPFKVMIWIMQNYRIDVLVTCGNGSEQENHKLPWTGETSYHALVRKFYPNVELVQFAQQHHLAHAASAFYGSGFDTATALVVDGCGASRKFPDIDDLPEHKKYNYFETESIYKCSWPDGIDEVWKRYAENYGPRIETSNTDADAAITLVKSYEAVTEWLGFPAIEAGKTMGLAPYGRHDDNIPNLFMEETLRGDKNIFIPSYPRCAYLDHFRFPYLSITGDFTKDENDMDVVYWHRDKSKLRDVHKNMAWRIQKETQEMMCTYIEKAVDMTGEKNIVISGGYGLNVISNTYYKEKFPNLNIYVDPICHDGGLAIGAAKYVAIELAKRDDITYEKDPLGSLYLGPDYKYNNGHLDSYLKVNKLEDEIEVTETTDAEVAQLIKDRNIVTIFQGRSEGGPRALGNRSILYDPTDPNGKDFVNTIKGREWFRPFAASILKEHAKEWFNMKGLKETPYMMYALEVSDEHIGDIPAVTHVDGTCRIQTVSKLDNTSYYALIKEFYKLTGTPLLFNTSFNLGGEPLVENIDDAIHTLRNSKLEYMYMPELGKLIKVPNKEEETDG
tara:strand:- start:51 stop:1841 length:1791 start_codon:yes stop_codon:yes gene_type:complete